MTSKNVWLAAAVLVAVAMGAPLAQADIHTWVSAEPGMGAPDASLLYRDSSPSGNSYGWPCEIDGMSVSYNDATGVFDFVIGTNFGDVRNNSTVWRDSYRTGTMAQFAAGDLYIKLNQGSASTVYGLSLASHTSWSNSAMDYMYGKHMVVTPGTLYGDVLFATGSFEAYVQERNYPAYPVLPVMTDAQSLPELAPEPVSKMVYDKTANPLNYYPTLLLEGTAVASHAPASYDSLNKQWTGSFSLPDFNFLDGDTVDIWWAMQCGNDAARVTTTGANPVPAPSSLLLLCVGSICTAGFARRRGK